MSNLPDPKQFPCTPEGYAAYYKALRPCGRDQFFIRFEGGKNADNYFLRSKRSWDMNFAPYLATALPHDMRGAALEIGYGGGGMLAAAAGDFARVAGVDVHDEAFYVADELMRHGVQHYELKQGDGKAIPFADNEFDFVYSWCVMLHVVDEATLCAYLAEAHRVLKPRGAAMLYVERMLRGKRLQTREEWLADCAQEAARRLMCMHIEAEGVNTKQLKCSLWRFEELAAAAGFSVGTRAASVRAVKHDGPSIAGQHTAVLVKA